MLRTWKQRLSIMHLARNSGTKGRKRLLRALTEDEE